MRGHVPFRHQQGAMMAVSQGCRSSIPAATITVDRFTDGILDPAKLMLGPVRNGGTIEGVTAPGCWGPMITPAIRGGHEVTLPVAVEGRKSVTPSPLRLWK